MTRGGKQGVIQWVLTYFFFPRAPAAEYDLKKLLKAFKKEFACNGTLVEDEELGQVIQLQGDQRQKISTFLIEEGIPKQDVKVHGF